MKTKLRFMALVLLGIMLSVNQVWGASINASHYEGQGISGGKTDGSSAVTATVDGVTVTCSNGYKKNTNNYVQFYSSSVVTVSSSSSISNITFVCTTTSGNYSPAKISLANGAPGKYTSSTGVWTGTGTSISFNMTAQVRMTSMTITTASTKTAV